MTNIIRKNRYSDSNLPTSFNDENWFLDPFVGTWEATINQIFDGMFSNKNRIMDVFKNQASYPKTDVFETNDEVIFELAIPGLEKEDVQIQFEDNILTVKHEKNKTETTEGKIVSRELRKSSFARAWKLPTPIKEDQISANIKNGILTIKLPFEKPTIPEKKTKNIPIE